MLCRAEDGAAEEPDLEWPVSGGEGVRDGSGRRAPRTDNPSGLWLRAWLAEPGTDEAPRVEIR